MSAFRGLHRWQGKPGAFWVGILKHHKLPSHDLGVEGRSSDVSSRIYCDIQKLGRKIGFRYGTAILEMDVVVASLLMAGHDTVVLEVILESELPTRAFAVTPVVSGTATDSTDPKRTPLPDVTKHGFGSFETGQREA